MWARAVAQGAVAGLAGVLAMTAAEKVEQRFTGRPDSYVPGRTLSRLAGLPDRPRRSVNLAMHFGQGVLLGALRGVMATAGLRGPWASAMFWAVRLTNDQTLENATGVGAPPWTWPRRELVIDLAHKGVYAAGTGLVADWLASRYGEGPGQRHASLAPGRRSGVGPVAR
ncbi:hypothetical protein L1857_33810 [Amycolatopsis thermalba]|uniref:DUF1440 domain-containing protein n=1 Tax=Amycolatopsis thermalba TaxID=944492 RepID=A0ABY4P5A5_9PSEU|nr:MULTISPECIES: hypothetical protein [Amycolatopsis]OXM61217.1 hypothetical protein CF166_34310 [Amycolatopsis sp. KNN50.9b]UQS27422.1 hypothetical protein L1857_33810 [Amycolatopsis thermalba]